jgi:hypothetical protein
MSMLPDPTAPIRLGFRIGIAVVRFELRVLAHLLGRDDGHEPVVVADAPPPEPFRADPAVVASEPEPAVVASEPEPVVATSEPEPAVVASEPEPVVATSEPDPAPVASEPEPEPLDAEPAHLDTEPELVAEFAEPGAEDGAGAEIRVEEPWRGYRKMRVAEVRERVAVANAAELAVLQLYEAGHRNRRSVLDAVERRSKELANAPRA